MDYGKATKASPDERGRNRHAWPTEYSSLFSTLPIDLRFLHLNLFEKRELTVLLRGEPPVNIQTINFQMTLV